MDNKRILNINFWDEEDIYDLDANQKLFYLYILTNSKTNAIGVYKFNISKAVIETAFKLDEIMDMLAFFEERKKIYYSDETKELLIVNWTKHNYPLSQKDLKELNKEVLRIKDKNLQKILYSIVKGYGNDINLLFKNTIYIKKEDETKSKVKSANKEKNKKDISVENVEVLKAEKVESYIKEEKEDIIEKKYIKDVVFSEDTSDEENKYINVENIKIENKNIKSSSKENLKEVIDFYRKYVHEPNDYEKTRITNWCKHMEYKAVILAILEAIKYGIVNIDYIGKIINRWYKLGFRSKREVEQYLEN